MLYHVFYYKTMNCLRHENAYPGEFYYRFRWKVTTPGIIHIPPLDNKKVVSVCQWVSCFFQV